MSDLYAQSTSNNSRRKQINVDDEKDRASRNLDLMAQENDLFAKQEKDRENKNFVQIYDKGFTRLQLLIAETPAAARLYLFLAQHIGPGCGAVVVTQEVIAESLNIHKRTVIRLSKQLEEQGAIWRVRVGVGVIAYCLDDEEIWKSYHSAKKYSAFNTKTLVAKNPKTSGLIDQKIRLMIMEKKAKSKKKD